MEAPMPLDAPVTTATFPESVFAFELIKIRNPSCLSCRGSGCRLDEFDHFLWSRNEGDVTGFYLGSCRVHSFRHESLQIRTDRAVFGCNEVPRRNALPGCRFDWCFENLSENRLLSGSRDPGFRWRNILRKNIVKFCPVYEQETSGVGHQRRADVTGLFAALWQGPERFPCVRRECGDVNQSFDVCGLCRGDGDYG